MHSLISLNAHGKKLTLNLSLEQNIDLRVFSTEMSYSRVNTKNNVRFLILVRKSLRFFAMISFRKSAVYYFYIHSLESGNIYKLPRRKQQSERTREEEEEEKERELNDDQQEYPPDVRSIC